MKTAKLLNIFFNRKRSFDRIFGLLRSYNFRICKPKKVRSRSIDLEGVKIWCVPFWDGNMDCLTNPNTFTKI